MGQSNKTDTNTPVLITSNVKSISAGDAHVLFITTTNDLYGIGDSYYGQTGKNGGENISPYKIFSDINIASSGDRYSMIIKNYDTLWAAGSDSYGKKGDGNTSTAAHTSFYQTSENVDGVSNVFAGENHTLLIDSNDDCYSVGANHKVN